MEFSRQESWSGLPFPPPRDLPNPGMEPGSPTLQVNSLPSEPKTHKVPLLGLKTQPRVFPGGPVVNISTFPLRGTRVPFLVGKLTYRMLHGTAESEVAQSCPTLCDPWTVAHQAPPSMGFSRQEYWSGLPFPSPRKNKKMTLISQLMVSNGNDSSRLPVLWGYHGPWIWSWEPGFDTCKALLSISARPKEPGFISHLAGS